MKSDATEPPVLVIGYGNILRRDDGVGWAVARRLLDQLPRELATVLTVPQLLPELAEQISRAQYVVFIDADAQLPPGVVQKLPVRPDDQDGQILGHHQTPAGILRLASDLYARSPAASIYSIGGADFSFGCNLSPPVQAALRKVVQDIVDAVILFARDGGIGHL